MFIITNTTTIYSIPKLSANINAAVIVSALVAVRLILKSSSS